MLHWFRSAALGMAGFTLSLAAHSSLEARPSRTRIDLRSDQTSIKNQGQRRSCITFASTAALEASLKRGGYGELDLSEDFAQYMIKTLWLNDWPVVSSAGASARETQLGFTAGGNSAQSLGLLAGGMRIPAESVWPYKTREYSEADHPFIASAYNSPFFASQIKTSEFNLTSGFLTKSRLTAPLYYSATGFKKIDTRRNSTATIAALEDALAQRREVVMDFLEKYSVDQSGGRDTRILKHCESCNAAGHAVLLVGYDRSDPDPAKHFFIVKNSWGPNHPTTRTDGFTYLSYDLVTKNITSAGYITGAARPGRWNELGFMGRWDMNYDGYEGMLDIYHVPGSLQYVFYDRADRLQDRRIGSFYPKSGGVFRVNGRMNDRHITFYVDKANANARFDQIAGQRFELDRLAGDDLAAGVHADPGTPYYGVLMVRRGSSTFSAPVVLRGHRPESMIGKWEMTYGSDTLRTVSFAISAVARDGTISGRGGVAPITGKVTSSPTGGQSFRIRGMVNDTGYVDGFRFSWNGNLASGVSKWDDGRQRGGVIFKKIN